MSLHRDHHVPHSLILSALLSGYGENSHISELRMWKYTLAKQLNGLSHLVKEKGGWTGENGLKGKVNLCVYTCICIRVFIYVYVYVCMCIHMCVCMHVYIYTYAGMYVYVYICMCIYACSHMHVYTCMCVYICMCINVCVYMHV